MTPEADGLAHRRLSLALVVVATLLAFLAIFAVWANRQLLNSNNWADTSSKLLQNEAIRSQLSTFLVNQLYSNVNVQATVQQALPPRAAPLSGEIAGGLKELAQRATTELLGRPRAQAAWEEVNRRASKRFIQVLEGGGSVVSTKHGTVTLDLKALLQQSQQNVGVGGKVASKLPASAAQLTIMRSDQLKLAQDIVRALKALAIALVVLAIGLFALAVYLARGWRRRALRACGYGLVAAGALALLGRGLAGNTVVNALAKTESVKPAADAAWSISTSLLVAAATATIAYGIVVVLGAWLAGPTHSAVGARRGLAPYLRAPRHAYGGLAVIILLLLAWGPTPALRKFVPAVVLIGLLVLGVEVLRRQVAREYPDASIEESVARMRERLSGLGRRMRRDDRRPGTPDAVSELERLAKLRDSGVLSAAEFEVQKQRLLDSTATVSR